MDSQAAQGQASVPPLSTQAPTKYFQKDDATARIRSEWQSTGTKSVRSPARGSRHAASQVLSVCFEIKWQGLFIAFTLQCVGCEGWAGVEVRGQLGLGPPFSSRGLELRSRGLLASAFTQKVVSTASQKKTFFISCFILIQALILI